MKKVRRNSLNLVGQRFGMLLVVARGDESERRNWMRGQIWKCQCDCGNTKTLNSAEIRRTDRRSCGCHRTKWRRSELTAFNTVFARYVANARKRKLAFALTKDEFSRLI